MYLVTPTNYVEQAEQAGFILRNHPGVGRVLPIFIPLRDADLASASREYSKLATIVFAIMALCVKVLDLPGKDNLIVLVIVGYIWYAVSDRIFQNQRSVVEELLRNLPINRDLGRQA